MNITNTQSKIGTLFVLVMMLAIFSKISWAIDSSNKTSVQFDRIEHQASAVLMDSLGTEDLSFKQLIPKVSEVMIVDNQLQDIDILVQGLRPEVHVVRLDSDVYGIEAIEKALQGLSGLNAVHVISHGSNGQLQLSGKRVNQRELMLHRESLRKIGATLQANGDILLYGCDVAAGGEGIDFINTLATITGADVTASNNRSGANGDWVLEVTTGAIETQIPLTVAAMADYSHDLAIAITSATYDWSTGNLVITGTDFVQLAGAANDVDASLLTITGDWGSYTLTDTSDVDITSVTSATLTLSATDRFNVHGLLNKNGNTSGGGVTYNLAAADNWLAGAPDVDDISDLTGNGITVSNVATPTIVSAAYDAATHTLFVTGTNLFKKPGTNNDIDVSLLTMVGTTSYTLATTSDVEITSATSFTVHVTGSDMSQLYSVFDQLGTTSSNATIYNIQAADGWLTAADPAVDISDNNAEGGVSVTINPQISSSTYNATTGVLVVTGSNIEADAGSDIDVSQLTFTGEGGATYTLTDSADVERDSTTQFTVTLSVTDKAGVNQLLNKNGTSSVGGTTYNLSAADDWCACPTSAAADISDTTNAITVSSVPVPTITSATYNASTGALAVTGTTFLSASGASNDITANKFTFTGEGGETYTLTDTANVEITSGTAFTLNLSATDRAAVNLILNKNGTASTGGTTYNLAASEDWAAGADSAVNVVDVTGNGITVSNVVVPAITSATYDASTGVLAVTGTNLLKSSGAANDIISNKFTFTGEGGETYTLTDTADVEITSSTSFIIILSAADKAEVNKILNKNGNASTGGTPYNLAAAEDWAAGADPAVNVVDATGNGITVSNVNNPPVITSNGGGADAAISVNENSTAVTTVTATDLDGGDMLAYSISGGADAAKFSIDSSSGVLAFVSAPDYENPTDNGGDNVYNVQVTVTDDSSGNLSDMQDLEVTVQNINEPPTITSDGGGASASANVPSGQINVTEVEATDEDVGDTLTYSISGGSDAAKFIIDGSTGVLDFVSAPDYDNPTDNGGDNVYNVQVTVTDDGSGSLTDVQDIAVTVIAAASGNSYTGQSPTGTGQITATVTGGGTSCKFTNPKFLSISAAGVPLPTSPPVEFPHGLFDFSITGCTPGATIKITMTYPQALPGTTQYWKYGPTPDNATPHWYVLPTTISGNTVMFSITDGKLGDDDLTVNGTFVDIGGAASVVDGGGASGNGKNARPIPTLSDWALIALSALLMLGAAFTLRRWQGSGQPPKY